MDLTSASASKPGTSQTAVNLDLPPLRRPRTTSNVEQMEVDYGPALPPLLGADHHNTSDQLSSPSEEPSKKALDRLKKHSHSHRKHDGFHFLYPKNMLTKVNIRLGPEQPQHDPDPAYYREVALSDIPSQYAE